MWCIKQGNSLAYSSNGSKTTETATTTAENAQQNRKWKQIKKLSFCQLFSIS